jgi:5-methylcytosine-specific restriction endonuclease McrA
VADAMHTPPICQGEDGRVCRLCGIWKPLPQFKKDKRHPTGRSARCLACSREAELGASRARAAPVRAAKAEAKEAAVAHGSQACTGCGVEKSFSEFTPKKRSVTGYRRKCRACHNVDDLRRARARGVGLDRNARRKAEAAAMLRRGALVCSRCGVEKTLDLMMRRSGSIRGYGARCKACSVEHTRRWKTENPEKMAIYLAQQNAREEANPEIRRLKWRKRRARLVGAEGSFTDKDLAEIRRRQKDRCAACRQALHGGGEADHIVALAAGGSNHPRNIQLLCPPCNRKKHVKPMIVFMQELGFLL